VSAVSLQLTFPNKALVGKTHDFPDRHMSQSFFHLHLISDAGEEALIAAGRAVAAIYPHVTPIEHIYPHVRTSEQLNPVIGAIKREPGIVLHRMTDPVMAGQLERSCRAIGAPSLSLLKLGSKRGAIEPSSYSAMINLHLKTRSRAAFRLSAMIFAAILGLLSLWLLAAALVRPTLPYFLTDAAAAKAAAAQRDRAGAAAQIGFVRGDLWADYAMALAAQLPQAIERGGSAAPPSADEHARAAAERAARLAPHDSRVWLLLAGERASGDAAGALRMSYFTGPNEPALTPLRLLIAARSNAIADPDLQILVGQEIRTVVTRKPDLKPSILVAYRNASPEGRRFIEAKVGELDPTLLGAVRATVAPK
jgi:hypothetical protein